MSMFESYDDEFVGICQEISSKLSHVSNYIDGHEEKLSVLSELESSFDQAKTLLKQMEVETRGEQNPALKQDMSEKVASHKKLFDGLRKDASDSKINEEHAMLIDNPSIGQKDRLISANERLGRGSERIKYALQLTEDTENTALEITDELARNREKIEGVSARVKSVSGLTDQARRVIQGMSKREIQQKVMLWIVA
eukprot:CAMPEP_0114399792 /NCGR_PEP_ID=MMETSP0102-20121206/15889_1 /TAXON_ID=38822 ORGANISM="Pteridomonas danica, Strain PT" /NCGR_SAMPLE_ID=MMETSP0102 /ASSEMBLY_ACC=CAM_ASM_000212 /LENGTH=195 /DNA_ID=CAMNT_0001561799 /DNA_START=23 /DNA_END=606 /DNA_ORIENTATION=-